MGSSIRWKLLEQGVGATNISDHLKCRTERLKYKTKQCKNPCTLLKPARYWHFCVVVVVGIEVDMASFKEETSCVEYAYHSRVWKTCEDGKNRDKRNISGNRLILTDQVVIALTLTVSGKGHEFSFLTMMTVREDENYARILVRVLYYRVSD